MKHKVPMSAALLGAASLLGMPAHAGAIDCEMDYTLSGWSAIYKTAKGSGTVRCDNGQTLKVKLRTEGGGLTVGKSTIDNGHAEFAGVNAITDVLGDYVAGGAHAGAVKSAEAKLLTKGEVSLALGGTGRGFDLGVDLSKFTISRE